MNWTSRQEISDRILSLRNSGKIDDAVNLCLEADKKFPKNYFYPKIAGDLYFQQGNYDAASRMFVEFLKRIPNSENLFTDFARRYYKLRRVLSASKISEYASVIASEGKKGCFKSQIKTHAENLIKPDLPIDFVISELGKAFIALLNDDKDFNKLVGLENKLETTNSSELEFLLDQYVLNRKRSLRTYRVDAYSVSIYEKKTKFDHAIKVAEELLTIKIDSVLVRSIMRICRIIGNYQRVENILRKYPQILKSNDFNILYELVYFFENQNNFEQVQSILQKIEKMFADSIPILRTVRNFYLRFGLFDDVSRVDDTIKDRGAKERFLSAVQETDKDVGSKIKELYSEVEHKTRLAAISDLTTGISHELGQPITNIRYTVQFYTKMFEKRLEKEEVSKVFASILEETERMGALVKRLSPLTSGKTIIEKFDVVDRIRKRVQAENTRLNKEKISVNILPNRSVFLYGDPIKFDQIISNLLLNSIDAIHDKKEREQNKIDIRVSDGKDEITILFADNGMGIPATNRGKVFDPFFTTKSPGKGEGLGLFIVWNIVKMYGGKIVIDPKINKGTQFLISIPKDIELIKGE